MAGRAEQELRDTLEKRKAMAMDRIAQAELAAIRAVQQNVADIAIKSAHTIIEREAKPEALLTMALDDVEKQLAS